MKLLDLLAKYLAKNLNHEPLKIVTWPDNGRVINVYGHDNESFKLAYRGNLVLQEFAGNVAHVLLLVNRWNRKYNRHLQPDNEAVVEFDTVLLNRNKIDLHLSLEITEITIVQAADSGVEIKTLAGNNPPEVCDYDGELTVMITHDPSGPNS